MDISEIRKWEEAHNVPNVVSYVKGVINLRGNIIPILDLRLLFNFSDVVNDDSTVNIITKENQDGERIGLVIDSVKDVLALDKTNIQHPFFCE